MSIQAKNRGPGPGAYLMPTLTGFEDHDIRRRRPPAYSMGQRIIPFYKVMSPGPQYTLEKYFTRYGKDGTPAYTMRPKTYIMTSTIIPGPGAHSPEHCPRLNECRPPEYTMSGRTTQRKNVDSPSPAAYTLPHYIGPGTPVRISMPAWSLGNREKGVPLIPTPSPAEYKVTDLETYKRRNPKFEMSYRVYFGGDRTPRPGPAAYYPVYNQCREPPNYSFGIKHSPFMKPVILECDN